MNDECHSRSQEARLYSGNMEATVAEQNLNVHFMDFIQGEQGDATVV